MSHLHRYLMGYNLRLGMGFVVDIYENKFIVNMENKFDIDSFVYDIDLYYATDNVETAKKKLEMEVNG